MRKHTWACSSVSQHPSNQTSHLLHHLKDDLMPWCAAAMVGFVHAMAALSSASVAANLHLRALNPLLGSILTSSRSGGSLSPAIPRQACQIPLQAAQSLSSFAFQGTNAHAVLAASQPPVVASGSSQQGSFQRDRVWFAPVPNVLLHTAAVLPAARSRARAVHLAARLDSPALAFLADHVIQGRVLVPGAAMFEIILASVSTLAGPGNGGVVGAAITAPLVISPGGSCTVSCCVDPISGTLGLHSAQGHDAQHQQHQHLTATAGTSISSRVCPELAPRHVAYGVLQPMASRLPHLPRPCPCVLAAPSQQGAQQLT